MGGTHHIYAAPDAVEHWISTFAYACMRAHLSTYILPMVCISRNSYLWYNVRIYAYHRDFHSWRKYELPCGFGFINKSLYLKTHLKNLSPLNSYVLPAYILPE